MNDAIEELLELERTRCAAISSGDIDSVERLLADDLSHTHINGRTDNKSSLLSTLRDHPRRTSRGDDVRVRLHGDVAIMTGTQHNTVIPTKGGEPVTFGLHVLQVWVKGGDGWKLTAFASSAQAPKELLLP